MSDHYLTPLFEPDSVAIFGASEREGSIGAIVFANMLEAGFQGEVHAINPAHQSVLGHPCYRNLAALNQDVALAVIATPPQTVPGILQECGERRVRAAVVLTAGFREAGVQGRNLERAVVDTARRYGIRFVGPNCLGLIRPRRGFNATFYRGTPRAGHLALVSQSGALCTAILDWASSRDIGFSAVVSIGGSADVDFGEALDFLATDQETHAILLYIEGIRDARKFMSSLRACARGKPVIVIKAGRTAKGSQAALSHTGALVGEDDVFDAALRRAGVIRGTRLSDLFAAAQVLARPMRAQGNRLVIVTNGGGPGAVASDRASDLAVELAQLGHESMDALDKGMPSNWSHGNPVDIIGDADEKRYRTAMETVLQDPGVDGMLVILTPQAMTRPVEVARAAVEVAKSATKPIITCWMGGRQVRDARMLLAESGLPTFNTPETAVEGFAHLTNFHRNQELLLQAPGPLTHKPKPDIEGARAIIENVLGQRRQALTYLEAKAVLAAFRIPVTPSVLVHSAHEALVHAESVGFPIAMKVLAKEVTHKSEIGGVQLGLSNASAVQSAYRDLILDTKRRFPELTIDGIIVEPMVHRASPREVLVGIKRDDVFGPVLVFGTGGTAVEVIKDRAMALPPLNSLLAEDLIARTRVSESFGVFRGAPAVNREAVSDVLLRISELACELPWISELDINPLIVDEHGAIAVDARIVVRPYTPTADRYAHMAIHPYPNHLVDRHLLSDGTSITIRPIRPEDARIEAEFVKGLSPEARFFRFLHGVKELTPSMLARFTQIDYDREMAFIAVVEEGDDEREVAVARYVPNPDASSCEFAVVVADAWQGRGIAHRLVEALLGTARQRGFEWMEGYVLAENQEMLAFSRSLGFEIKRAPSEDHLLHIRRRP